MKNKSLMSLVILICLVVSFVVYKYYNDFSEQDFNIDSNIEKILSTMTIEEKIGQMVVINVEGNTVTENIESIMNEVKPSGIILMKENFSSYEHTKKFVEDLKSMSDYPFIVSIDQEGGPVQRLKFLEEGNATDIPDMYSIGSLNDKVKAYNVGKVMALEMRTLGINVDYAPVVDIYSNSNNTVIGNRSFSENKDVVSTMAISLAKGLEDNGVIATYKHFPGHGDTEIDSHMKLPIIYKTKEEVENLELVPFKNVIANDAKLIMVGHIAFPLVTLDNTPASLSKKIVTGILKEELGFNGLVITDALNMKALTDNYSNEDIYIKSIEAGCDILLMPVDAREAISDIKNNIDEKRIDESVRKILKFKFKYLDKDNSLDKMYLGSEEHKKIIKDL